MKKLISVLVTIGMALPLAGCVTQGRDFEGNTEWIKVAKTSQNDVRLMLKDPYSVGNSSGVPTWTYGFYRYRLFGRSFTKELKFYWKPDQTVDHFSYNSSFPMTKGGEE